MKISPAPAAVSTVPDRIASPSASGPASGIGAAPLTNGSEPLTQPARSWHVGSVVVQTLISLFLLAASVAGVLALFASRTSPRPVAIDAALPQVETAAVVPWAGPVHFEVDGVVVPFREINIAAQVSGRVTRLGQNLRVGSSVRRGDTLVTIDSRDYELETQRLTSERDRDQLAIKEVDAELASNQHEAEAAEEDLKIRRRQLARYEAGTGRGVFSDSEIDTARLNETAARRSLQTLQDAAQILAAKKRRLESLLAIAEAQLATAQLKQSRTEITSPVDGVVTAIQVEPNGYATAGAAVMTVQDTSCMEVQCKLQARQMQWVWEQPHMTSDVAAASAFHLPAVPARVVYSSGTAERSWPGRLSRYDGAGFDTTTRMIPVKVLVDQPRAESAAGQGPEALLRGMFVKVRFEVPTEHPLLQLPADAVTADNRVWLVHEGRLSSAEVEVVWNRGDTVVVTDPAGQLSEAAMVVTSPVAFPVEGMSVDVASTKVFGPSSRTGEEL